MSREIGRTGMRVPATVPPSPLLRPSPCATIAARRRAWARGAAAWGRLRTSPPGERRVGLAAARGARRWWPLPR